LGSDVARPAGNLAAGTRAGSQGLFAHVSAYFNAAQQNAGLQRELAAAKVRLVESEAQAEENRRLKALLGLADTEPRPVAYARLIASTAASSRRFATLSVGTGDGIAAGMPVRGPEGLVGRVLETASSTARVLLITDGESVVPIRRASDSLPGFAEGRADGRVQIRLISLGINPLKLGDAFVTSGSGGLYPPGMPIAIVESLTRDGAVARVLADPAASDYVAVLPVWVPQAVAAEAAVRP
jgi:rod shape-determining protein MreC